MEKSLFIVYENYSKLQNTRTLGNMSFIGKKRKMKSILNREKRKTRKKIRCEIKKIIKKRGSLKIILYQKVQKNEEQLYR